MAFTSQELAVIADASLDYYLNKGKAFDQSLQARPLVNIMESNRKTFPGGKGDISVALLGEYGAGGVNDKLSGYTHDDVVNFYTPANLTRATFPWREMHIGIELTQTELKIDGISVVDTNGARTTKHSQREKTALVDLFDLKLQDMGEQYARSLNLLLWGDGTTDPKALAGLRSLVTADPSVGTVGGINRATKSWWRNRARTAAFDAKVTATPSLSAHGGGPVTSDPANGGALCEALQVESRQLTRYGGRPNQALVGSDFLGALERELRANGNFHTDGESIRGGADVSVGDIRHGNLRFKYDPTLDDLGLSKRAYIFDTRTIMLMAMEDEWRRKHTPSRPADQFVLFRSLTCTGQLVARQLNNALVMDIT